MMLPEQTRRALELTRQAIVKVEKLGAKSQSGMLADANYEALLILREIETILKNAL